MSHPKYLIAVPLAILVCFSFPTIPLVYAQDGDAEPSEQNVEKKPSLSDQIQKLLKDQNPAAARTVLKEALDAEWVESKTESGMNQLQGLHQQIAFGFLNKREFGKAIDELVKSFDSVLNYPDVRRKALMLANIVQMMDVVVQMMDAQGFRSSSEELVAKKIDYVIEHFRKLEAENVIEAQAPLSNLVVMRARMDSGEGRSSSRDMLVKQIETLDGVNATDHATEQTIAAQFRLLVATGSLFDDFDDRTRIEKLFESSMESFPGSEGVLDEFASAEYKAVSHLARTNPLRATERLQYAIEKLSSRAEVNDNLKRKIERIQSLEGRIRATAKQQELIGKPAPELQFDAWTNTDEFNVDELKGKVVLHDFWAVWCGPCIATFPHLREWRKEFGEKGFEIVGITRYYNYEWDEDADRAVRSKEEVDPELERATVARFLQSLDMQHPTIFTPKGSTLQEDYGVTGIPHAVLVDRDGNVQMVRVGSGQDSVDALREKIEELIEQ